MKQHHPIEKTARRDGVGAALRDWKAAALFAGITVLFFYRILLGEAWLWEDMMYFSYPVRVFAATTMAMGHIPLWNPYTFSGMPFLADIQTTVFYLPCIALALFVRNGGLSFYWLELMVIAHYALAGWAMYLLSSSYDLKRVPALFAGVSYMLSGFMIAHAIHQQIITMVAWFPLIAMLFRTALTRAGWRPVFLCALLLGHSTFAGYPQLSLFFHSFLFAYFVFLLLHAHRGKSLLSRPALVLAAKAGVIVGLGLAVAAIQLLPTAELAGLSQRAQISYGKSTEGSLAWSQILTLFIPKLFGSAGATGNTYWGPGTYWYYWETCIYIGILPLILVVISALYVRRNPHVAFFWGVALVALLFALGNNFYLHKLVLDYVPGFSTFRNPARAGIFFSFAGSLLSAFALQALMSAEQNSPESRRIRVVLFSAAALGVALWAGVISGALDQALSVPNNPVVAGGMRKEANWALLFVLASGAALLAVRANRTRLALAAVLLTSVFVADMFVFGADQNTSASNPADHFQRADPLVRFLHNDMKGGLFRVNTRNEYGMVMDRNQGMVDRIFTLEGYTPLVLQRAMPPCDDLRKFDLLNVKYKTVFDRQRGTLSLAPHPTFMPRAFILYEARVARTEGELAAALTDSAWNQRTTAILEEDPPPLGHPAAGAGFVAATVTAFENSSVDIEATSPADGILVLSEVYYPGWKAFVDGRQTEILRTDYSLRGIAFPAGSHRVEFRFTPPPFVAGAWITAGALLVCLTGLGMRRTGRRSQQEEGR
ncbi:MAG TPA: YfhO family protein [Bacteroidota bacterium]|nr:YfhO family protein [Bacteroidota bacterium]